jgi:hypothetical protein
MKFKVGDRVISKLIEDSIVGDVFYQKHGIVVKVLSYSWRPVEYEVEFDKDNCYSKTYRMQEKDLECDLQAKIERCLSL